jgi:hypothetical protein
MELHLSSIAHGDTTEFRQLSSLYRLLKRAVATRSEREILRTFIEALAVWQDADSLAYVADVTGQYVLDVTLPGSDRTSAPATIDAEQIAGDLTTFRLPPAEREALGFQGSTDVMLSRVRGRATSDWIVASCAPVDSIAEARLAVYVEAVSQSLTEMASVESSRLTWAMLQHLLPTTDSIDRSAQGAMEALTYAASAEAFFAVARNDGTRVLTAGDARDVDVLAPPARKSRLLMLPVDVPPPLVASIGVRRASETPLAGREERLLQSAASTLSAWLHMIAPKLATRSERRSGIRSFDQLLQQKTRDARETDKVMSVMIVVLAPDPPAHDVRRACVTQIRGQLRPEDIAGELSSGHIGVLLPDTPPEGASVVAERLKHFVKAGLGFGSFPQASVVFAYPSTDLSAADAQLRDAYARVMGDVRRMRGSPH